MLQAAPRYVAIEPDLRGNGFRARALHDPPDYFSVIHLPGEVPPSLHLRKYPNSVFRPGVRDEIDPSRIVSLRPAPIVEPPRKDGGDRSSIWLVEMAGIGDFTGNPSFRLFTRRMNFELGFEQPFRQCP